MLTPLVAAEAPGLAFRDVHAAVQHGALAPRSLELVGRVRLGVDTRGLL